MRASQRPPKGVFAKNIRNTRVQFMQSKVSLQVAPLIVAHKGASHDAPENTIPAFNLAWEQMADAIEGDFHLTGDGHVVCVHDKTTRRVADRTLTINRSTLQELRELDVGSSFGEKYRGTAIPTSSEVFATVPRNKKVYIEVKCGTEIISRLLKDLEDANLSEEQVVVISFDEDVLHAMKHEAPRFKYLWLCSLRKGVSGAVLPSVETTLETLRRIEADGLSSNKRPIGEEYIEAILGAGYEYHVWTVDNLNTAIRFKNWGAMSITTNVPGYMRDGILAHEGSEG